MEKKITVVEWLEEKIKFANKETYAELFENIQQAKAIEKGQIIDAYEFGNTDREFGIYLEAEEFYNKMYGNAND